MIRYYYRSCAAASTKNEKNPDPSQHPASTTTQSQSTKKNTHIQTSSHSQAAALIPPQNLAPNPPGLPTQAPTQVTVAMPQASSSPTTIIVTRTTAAQSIPSAYPVTLINPEV